MDYPFSGMDPYPAMKSLAVTHSLRSYPITNRENKDTPLRDGRSQASRCGFCAAGFPHIPFCRRPPSI